MLRTVPQLTVVAAITKADKIKFFIFTFFILFYCHGNISLQLSFCHKIFAKNNLIGSALFFSIFHFSRKNDHPQNHLVNNLIDSEISTFLYGIDFSRKSGLIKIFNHQNKLLVLICKLFTNGKWKLRSIYSS